ncbi:rhodanese-like domain-containing protein [Streptococcus agalactiae]|uniref:rhodanese-like domain-containing protein n=1 Tax=Streptococcus agalactiae TaxID=1311 RepID=UPI0002BBC1BE|nr:rhodanese-like domain-containing protein [Streptococcus agalactiae]EPT83475.1 rhodanese [Streptococcus agalactiae BSU450]
MTKKITVVALETLIAQHNNIHLIDVREEHEYRGGHIPGAINLPLSQLSHKFEQLDKNREYYLVCQRGGRSIRACQFLELKGYKVINVDGGTEAWRGNLEV